MANEVEPCLPVRCPTCSAVNTIRITHPAHKPLNCSGCNQSFAVDRTLIRQFYVSDDDAHWILEEFYRAPLVGFFLSRGVPQVEAEQYQTDVFTKIWET